jgi:N-acetylmuramoyl-L-alanine amidase
MALQRRAWAGLAMMLASAFVPAALLAAQSAAALTVTAVRHWSLGDSTRVVVEVSGEFRFRRDRLSNPDRIYFDILGAKPAVGTGRVVTLPVGDTFVKQIRVSETAQDITRVVLDLERPVDYTAAQLANPERLVVELRAVGSRRVDASPADAPAPAVPTRVAQAQVQASKEPTAANAQADGLPSKGPAAPGAAQPAKPAVTAPPSASEAAAKAPEAQPASPNAPLAVPARAAQSGPTSLVRSLGLKLGRVVLDPGHGGHDTGTIGRGGLMEKDLVLDLALRLGSLIEKNLGAEVIYTRCDDTHVPLEQRTAIANAKDADLFLSIHANAGSASVAGSETYYLNFSDTKWDSDVAARENATSERSIHELQALIEKILAKDKASESREFATRVQAALHQGIVKANANVKNRGVRRAPFVVLIGASMPSALSEVAFLSNPREERLLKREDYRQRIAEALYQGVASYASTLSRFRQPGDRGQP